ncbi:MAG: fructose-1,6-bisphosphatase [Bacteroidaceae bacterium]|nr:fructose-1,6-bisphosphatase [Bacteroidaceae bacterium]
MITEEHILADMRVLQLLSQTFPTPEAASTEIINLKAILNLPKGTEHFMADIHGEHEAFLHILRNASGNIKRKVKELYDGELTREEIRELCTLIYYPEKKLELIKASEEDLAQFYSTTLKRLIPICQVVSAKYTRSRVRKALPREFAYIIEELLHESPSDHNKQAYWDSILESIMETGQSDSFIIAISYVIQRLSVEQLHILGDVFDRGPGAHIIMDHLLGYHSFDFQWGNHDALWMGAAAGNDACIANVLRLSLRFGNMATLEDGYGINLLVLAAFAMDVYGSDPCTLFAPKVDARKTTLSQKHIRLIAKMHKAITVLQFKLEGQLIANRPEWRMHDRRVLDNIDFEKHTYTLDGKEYPLLDNVFPTIDPANPYALTAEEQDLVEKLHHSFRVSAKLQKHIKCILQHGCMYAICNSNLLFHASIPLNADGTLREVELLGQRLKGKALMHQIGMVVRSAFTTDTPKALRQFAIDYFWYLWCGPDSPLFDKSRMTTFERYFIADKATHTEEKGHYYLMRDNAQICDYILDAFGVVGEKRHIINGHVPVHVAQGENPIKADGKLMVIDGGFAEPYHHTTGIAGYTLVYHSRGFELIQHEPFTSTKEAVRQGTDIKSSKQIVEMTGQRMLVRDTDKGRIIREQIKELEELLYAYRHGLMR